MMKRPLPWRAAFFCALMIAAVEVLCPTWMAAQSVVAQPLSRITAPVDDSTRVTLRGNTSPVAQARYDHGPAPLSMPADRVVLVLQRSKQQEAYLQSYLESVQDPSSASYHKFLTPAEFGQRFGVSDADMTTVQSWLASHGLKVDKVSKGRMAIVLSGTVEQIQGAFHTSIHSYVLKGKQYWANATDPQIPAALAPVVAGLASLNSFKPEPQYIRGPGGAYNPATHSIRPAFTVGNTTTGYYFFLGPADAATIYDTPTTLNANHSGTTYDGTGVTIGIAGDSNIDLTQNVNYRATFGLSAKATAVVVDGADPGQNADAIEAYLDTQVAGGIAPNANVILYTAADTTYQSGLFLAAERAIDDNQVDILSVSFGACEAGLGAASNQYISDLWEQAAAQGISVTVASGDSGSADCDNPHLETDATLGLAVNGISSTPYNISVGGTDYDILYSNFPTSFTNYVDLTNTLANHRSALKYIPEEPWNNSTYPNTSISQNVALSVVSNYQTQNNIVAGGGGVSAFYPAPTWQSGFGSTAGRNVPDVSLLAGNGFYGALWGICTNVDTDASGNPLTDCAAGATGNNFYLTGIGGTSAAAPAFAGMLALLEQKTGSRLGQADYVLYKLAKSKYSTVFHDVATGDNSVSCVSGSTNCSPNPLSEFFLTGYDAKTGYDQASGLGSVDATQMVNNWLTAGMVTTTSTLQLNGATTALNFVHGQSVTVAGTVSGSGGTPTGDLALVDDLSPASYPGQEAIATFSLSGGAISGTTNALPGGSYNVSAHYGGDSTFAQSDSNAIAVTVGAESSTTNLKVVGYYDPATGQTAATPYYGYIYLLDAQPYGNSASLASPDGTATGTITFKSGTATLGAAQLSSEGVAELQTTTIPAGANSLTAVFPGDASFNASTSSPVSLAVQPAVMTASGITPTPFFPTVGASVTLSVTYTTDSAGAAPTGTVTFMDGTTTLGTVPLTGTAGSSTALAGATASYTTSTLPGGSNSITTVYSGDGNYAGVTSSATDVPVAKYQTTLTINPASQTFQVNQPLTVTVTPAQGTGLPLPTGTVSLYLNSLLVPAVSLTNGSATITIPANTLPLGSSNIAVQYSGDSDYGQASGILAVTVESSGTVTPTVAVVTPGGIVNYPVTVTVNVTGPSGDPTATGTVTLSNGSFFQLTLPLTNGSTTFSINGYGLVPGANTLTATYLGDSTYTSGTGTGTVTLIAWTNLMFTPTSPDFAANEAETVTVTAQGQPNVATPTGTIDLSGGGYDSGPVQMTAGAASMTIPANTFTTGSYTLMASYSGDTNYSPGTGFVDAYVTTPVPAGFSASGTAVAISAPGATTNNTSTITVTPQGGFTGAVALSAAITSSPAGAVHPPTLSFGSTSPVTISGTSAATATMTVTTTAATTGALHEPGRPGAGWLTGSAALACLLLFGIPARRRRWRQLLGMVVLMAGLVYGVSSCGGGSSGGGGGSSIPGTTPGAYVATVTGTSGTISAQTTIAITVQ